MTNMPSENLTCPYCNAAIGVSPNLSAGQRIVCPRCGDSFPLRPADSFTGQVPPTAETAITDRPTVANPTLPALDPRLRSRRSLGLFAALVVGVMLLMAGVGLAFMLMTQQQRRAYDTNRPPRRPGKQRGVPEPENPTVVAAVAPDRLVALRYLPEGVNFLVAARFPELKATTAGARLLHEPLFRFAEKDYRLDRLPAWVGLSVDDIDHIVFAAQLDDALDPRFYLVVRTAGPYDEEQLRERLKARRDRKAVKKPVYTFSPWENVSLSLWCAGPQTLIVAPFADLLDSLPDQPAGDLQRLPRDVRSVLTERREPVAPLWLAGHSRDWTKTPAGIVLGGLKKQQLRRIADLRTFGVWFVPDKLLGVRGVLECKDSASAHALDEWFHSLDGRETKLKTAQDGPWLLLQWQTEPDFLSRMTKR
jgi:hypothetical protein